MALTRTASPPAIDGRLDDSVWETATHVTDFVQIAPVEGAPGSEATDSVLFPMMAYQRTNRAFFGKVSCLFCYWGTISGPGSGSSGTRPRRRRASSAVAGGTAVEGYYRVESACGRPVSSKESLR